MTDWTIGNIWQRTQGTIQKELIGQDNRRSPIVQALNNLIHAPREEVKEFPVLQLQVEKRSISDLVVVCLLSAIRMFKR